MAVADGHSGCMFFPQTTTHHGTSLEGLYDHPGLLLASDWTWLDPSR